MPKQKRRRFNGTEKIRILKMHLLEGTPISNLCQEFAISPSQFYDWQRQLFEGGAALFDAKKLRPGQRDGRDQKITELELKLAHKNEVLSEAIEALVTAKKLNGDR